MKDHVKVQWDSYDNRGSFSLFNVPIRLEYKPIVPVLV